jgi:DNA-binding MarR family transcriptional regulator
LLGENWKQRLFIESNRDLYKLPPSAKFILYIMSQQPSVNRKYLSNQTLLSGRTIGQALKKLVKKGLIKKIKGSKIEDSEDERLVEYRLINEEEYYDE